MTYIKEKKKKDHIIENKHNTRINMRSVTRSKFKSPHFLLARTTSSYECITNSCSHTLLFHSKPNYTH